MKRLAGILSVVSVICIVFASSSDYVFADSGKHTTGAEDQVAVEVTAYNDDLGLIKDQRKVTLGKGLMELHFMDVAAKIVTL